MRMRVLTIFAVLFFSVLFFGIAKNVFSAPTADVEIKVKWQAASAAAEAEEEGTLPGGAALGGDFASEFLKKLITFIKKPPTLTPRCPDIDFNCDNRVDIQDLSIMLFYWDKPQRPYDINDDGRIDIQDVSILLYYWSE